MRLEEAPFATSVDVEIGEPLDRRFDLFDDAFGIGPVRANEGARSTKTLVERRRFVGIAFKNGSPRICGGIEILERGDDTPVFTEQERVSEARDQFEDKVVKARDAESRARTHAQTKNAVVSARGYLEYARSDETIAEGAPKAGALFERKLGDERDARRRIETRDCQAARAARAFEAQHDASVETRGCRAAASSA